MENEDNPNVAKSIKSLKTGWINFVDKSHTGSCIFDKSTLTWSAKFLSKTGFKEPDWLDIVCCLLFVIGCKTWRALQNFILVGNFSLTYADTHSVHKLIVLQMNIDKSVQRSEFSYLYYDKLSLYIIDLIELQLKIIAQLTFFWLLTCLRLFFISSIHRTLSLSSTLLNCQSLVKSFADELGSVLRVQLLVRILGFFLFSAIFLHEFVMLRAKLDKDGRVEVAIFISRMLFTVEVPLYLVVLTSVFLLILLVLIALVRY